MGKGEMKSKETELPVAATINDLPNEVLLMIFGRLELACRLRVFQVCHRWNQLVFHYFGDHFALKLDDLVDPGVLSKDRVYRHVEIRCMSLLRFNMLHAKRLRVLGRNVVALTLDISVTEGDLLVEMLWKFPNLESFSLRTELFRCDKPARNAMRKVLQGKIPPVRHVTISCANATVLDLMAKLAPNLRSLNVTVPAKLLSSLCQCDLAGLGSLRIFRWLRPVLHHFDRKRKIMRDLVDQLQFRRLRSRAPIPDRLSEFKNHPSYCLRRDLLKFQAIYPPNAPPLGFVHGEPIYARECVHTLHSREVWLRHAKTIRPYEAAYKVVMSKLRREPTQLELFGHWQTEPYVPPEPRDGLVPRNAYGNIELFKECMLPPGTVHLKQPNISRVCRRLNVDYAPAVVGFGVHAGGNHPVFEGIVICREFEQRILDEYERDLVEQEERQREKRERRIYELAQTGAGVDHTESITG